MPQATPALRRKFPQGDAQALEVLSQNFIVNRGGLIRKAKEKYKPTKREYDAIDYLFQEWDYAYDTESVDVLVKRVLKSLLDKMDKVEEDTKDVFAMAYIHGQEYKGENWKKEYDEARELLKELENEV